MLSSTSVFPSFLYWWYVICCTDVSPKPLQGYFSSDFFQQMFPRSQVCVLSSPPSRNSAMRLTYCSAAVAFELEGLQHCASLTSLLLPGCLVKLSFSNRPPCSSPCWFFRLQTHCLGCTKQLFVVPEMNLQNLLCSVCPKEELASPIIQAAKSYFPVESEESQMP